MPTGIGRNYCIHGIRWSKKCDECQKRRLPFIANYGVDAETLHRALLGIPFDVETDDVDDVLTNQEGSTMPKPLIKGFVILQQNVGYGLPNELFMKQNHRVPFDTLPEAEDNAKDLARANPGVRFYVAEIAVAVEVDERPVNMVVLR